MKLATLELICYMWVRDAGAIAWIFCTYFTTCIWTLMKRARHLSKLYYCVHSK